MEEIDIWRAAEQMRNLYGADDAIHAAMRAEELMYQSAIEGFCRKRRFLCIAVVITTLAGCAPRPGIVNGIVSDNDWYQWDGATQRFNAMLQRKFPLGSDEKAMIRTLQEQGFQYAPGAEPGCIPARDQPFTPIGKSYIPCPPYDPQHHLTWGRPTIRKTSEMVGAVTPRPGGLTFCREGLDVDWTAKDGRINSIKGAYGGYCGGGT